MKKTLLCMLTALCLCLGLSAVTPKVVADNSDSSPSSSSSSTSENDSTPTYAIVVGKHTNCTITVRPRYAERGDTVTITLTPDEGYHLDTLTAKDKDGNEMELTDKGEGKYSFKMPSRKITVDGVCVKDTTLEDYFNDVPENDPNRDILHWSMENGILTGSGSGSAYSRCTRAELVLYLWNAAGKSVVDFEMPFTDVPTDASYYEALRWAASLGLVKGTGDGLFRPEDPITREQVIVILFRYADVFELTDELDKETNILSYTDAEKISSWAMEALQWACGSGMVKGTSESPLSPQALCSRVEIITMLNRLLG